MKDHEVPRYWMILPPRTATTSVIQLATNGVMYRTDLTTSCESVAGAQRGL